MPPKRNTPFQPKHSLEYGLEVTNEGVDGQVVRCKFCLYEGREVVVTGPGSDRKRKSRVDIQYFYKPFTPYKYKSHHEGQHAESWEYYQTLSNEDKIDFFSGKKKLVNTLHHHLDTASDLLTFKIKPSIVDVIIGDLFFRDDEVLDNTEELNDDDVVELGATGAVAKRAATKAREKANALKLFVMNPETNMYESQIKNAVRYELLLDLVGSGMSFRQASEAICHFKKRTSAASKLGGMTSLLAGQCVRVLVASNLQLISDLMGDDSVWAFSFAGDGSTHRGQSFFDIRVRFCCKGYLENLHLVAIPMFDRHTAENIYNMVAQLLDALYPSWPSKLISVSSDGENTMTGRHAGFVTRLCNRAEYPLLRIWCPPHQIDLVVKATANLIDDGNWVKFVYTLSTYLRKQTNLITTMNVICPKKTTRWVCLGKVLEFYITYHRTIVGYVTTNKPEYVPTPRWWIATYFIMPAVEKVNITFALLQNKGLLLPQQERYVQELVDGVQVLYGIEPYNEQLEEDDIDLNEYVAFGQYKVLRETIVAFIKDQGSLAIQSWGKLSVEEKTDVVTDLANYAMELIEGLDAVQAERDNNNRPSLRNSPPILPSQLVKMRHSVWITEVLEEYRERIQNLWSEAECDKIEEEHRVLLKLYKDDENIKQGVDKHDVTTQFNEAWDVTAGHCTTLRSFCGGIATAFANTTSVESDFSILKWEMNPNRTSLMHLSLEGIFQAKQRASLHQMTG